VPIFVDLEKKEICAGVGELLGDSAHRAIGLTGSGLSRLWIGQELHRRVQGELEADESGVSSEIAVTRELLIDDWTLVLSGRADSVLTVDGVVHRVDEIKTLHFAVELYNLYFNERLERFRNQARIYALMLAQENPDCRVRLVLVDIVTGEQRFEDVLWSPDGVLAFLRQKVHRLVAVEQRRRKRLEALREAADQLVFPHPELRPAQQEIVESVAEALDAGRHLLLRAPTGSGKTAAALFPAVKGALTHGRRVFFLTAKTLQQRIAVQTVKALNDGLFRSMQLRAKSKMCANTEMICHEDHCPYARDYGLKVTASGIVDALLGGEDHSDPDHLWETARAHEVCPFEISLELLGETDVVVCDYNYVFDPAIGLGALLHGSALQDAVLVIDEAHNLVDRSREYYSPMLEVQAIERARAFLARRNTSLYRQLGRLMGDLSDTLRDIICEALGENEDGESLATVREGEFADLRLALDGAMLQYFIDTRENDLWVADDPVVTVFLSVTRFHRVLSLGGEEFVHLAERSGTEVERVKIFCRDAARFVGEVLEQSAGAIAMSATLEPFDFYHDLLGFDSRRTETLRVASPFPPENRLVLSIDDVDTTYKYRRDSYDPIAGWIARLCEPGHNVLTLFPSYDFLECVRDRLPPTSHLVLTQQRGSSDAEQHQFLEALGNGRSHLLLAVLGGIFAEGVDYPGSMLSQVIVVSPGLPQYNLERELLKAYYRERYGHSFAYAYLIPGMTRVVQAAGRLIRSSTDRGVIVLVGRRFQDRRYARLLPEEWISGDPTSMLHRDPETEVRRFFAAGRVASGNLPGSS